MTKYIKRVIASNGLKYYFGSSGTMIIQPDSKELKLFANTFGYTNQCYARQDIVKDILILALIDDPSNKLAVIGIEVD